MTWTVSLADLGVETVFVAGQRAGAFASWSTYPSGSERTESLASVRPTGPRSATVCE